MNQKTNVIKKNDFEKYEVMLPFFAAAGKRRKNYLCQELEKMHPCFSDEFGFDAVIRKVCRKGFKTDVLVMSKSRLAEYEGQRRFSGTGFLVDDSSESKWHRFFMSVKCKGTLCGIIICGLFCISGFSAGFFNSKLLKKGAVENVIAEESYGGEENAKRSEDAAAAPENVRYLSDLFFESVGNVKGRIDFFEWESDGFVEKLNASVSGVFPESFYGLKVGSVSYDDGVPLMSVSHTSRLPVVKNVMAETAGAPRGGGHGAAEVAKDFPKALRAAISSCNGKLCEESIQPYHIEFECDEAGGVANCLRKIDEFLSNYGREVCAVAVRRNGKNDFQIGLSIEESFPAVFDLCQLAVNLSLFKQNNPVTIKKNAVLSVSSESKNQKSETPVLNKVGEIKRPDNSVVIYYKSRDGKLEKVIKAQEVQ